MKLIGKKIMRGLWTESNIKLVEEVVMGNPGALRVIGELMWFTDWHRMMLWCKNNLAADKLWMKYKDDFNMDSHQLGLWLQEQMRKS